MKSITTLAMLLLVTKALSQPTLTSTTSVPPLGTKYSGYYNTQFTPSTGGAGKTWDFSTQSFVSPLNNKIYPCSALPNCSVYPATTFVDKDTLPTTGGLPIVFLKGAAGSLAITGTNGGGLDMPLTDPDEILRFPMIYLKGYTDAFKGSFNAGTIHYRAGNDSVLADGWGTLKTPAGTFTNTLRVKSVQVFKDSTDPTFVYNWKITTYTWYDALHKIYLFKTDSSAYTLNGTTHTTGSTTYTTGWTNNATAVTEYISGGNIEVFPQPAGGLLNIRIADPGNTDILITLFDALGRVAMSSQFRQTNQKGQFSIPTSGLARGLYMLQVNTSAGTLLRKVTIE